MNKNNQMIILETSVEKLEKDLRKETQEKIKNFIQEINYHESKLKSLSEAWDDYVNKVESIKLQPFYSEYKDESAILNILKEADIFLDKTRAFFTNQEIPYLVGFTYKGKLYQYKLTLEQVYSTVKLSYESGKTKSLKARILGSRKNIIQSLGEGRKSEVITKENIDYLYGKFESFGKKSQYGNVFEMLSYIEDKKLKYKNLKNDELKEISNKITKNTERGLKGPDTSSQVKYYKASLANVQLLLKYCKELKEALQKTNKADIKSGLKKLFTKDADDLNEKGLKEAKAHIDKIIDSLPNVEIK